MRHLFALLCCALLLATGSARAEVVAVDDRGRTVKLAAPARRIVTLLPSLTETVCALQACDRLVATDRYSDWPAAALKLPKVGGLEDANVERIVALKPDLVLAAGSARAVGRLESLGLKVATLEPKNHADMQRVLQAVAALLGSPGADALYSAIRQQSQAAAARVPAAWHGKRVYFEVDEAPYAAGPTSFIGETLQGLGLGNIVTAELGPFPKLNPEFVVQAQPDLVIGTRREVDAMASRPGWGKLRALREGRTCRFDRAQADVLVRPGPRLSEAAALVADCLARLEAPR
jgi:iron complex transport system substrate-binding protein